MQKIVQREPTKCQTTGGEKEAKGEGEPLQDGGLANINAGHAEGGKIYRTLKQALGQQKEASAQYKQHDDENRNRGATTNNGVVKRDAERVAVS